jgi:hypothetical protein
MNESCRLDKRYAAAAWGILFLLLGILLIVPGDQNAILVLGGGIVLLGLNLARAIRKIPVNTFSTTLGFLALGLGMVGLLGPALGLPHFEIPLVPAGLLIVGLYLLIPRPRPVEAEK